MRNADAPNQTSLAVVADGAATNVAKRGDARYAKRDEDRDAKLDDVQGRETG